MVELEHQHVVLTTVGAVMAAEVLAPPHLRVMAGDYEQSVTGSADPVEASGCQGLLGDPVGAGDENRTRVIRLEV
jgi:hypothetical protein